MIEEKEIGLKVAENPEEKFWTDVKTNTEKALFNCEHEMIMHRRIIDLCNEMLGKDKTTPTYVK